MSSLRKSSRFRFSGLFLRLRAVVSCPAAAKLWSSGAGDWSPAIQKAGRARPSTAAVVGWNGRLAVFCGYLCFFSYSWRVIVIGFQAIFVYELVQVKRRKLFPP